MVPAIGLELTFTQEIDNGSEERKTRNEDDRSCD